MARLGPTGLTQLLIDIKNWVLTKIPTKVSDLSNDSHKTITTSADTTSTTSPAHSDTFTCIDSVTRDTNGHVTTVNTKTITLPAQYTHPTTAGNKHIPSGGETGQILKYSSSGTTTWSDTNFTRTLKKLGTRTTSGTWSITCLKDSPVYVVGTVEADYIPASHSSVGFDITTIYNIGLGNGSYTATGQELNKSTEIMIMAIASATTVKITISTYGGSSFDSISLAAYQ